MDAHTTKGTERKAPGKNGAAPALPEERQSPRRKCATLREGLRIFWLPLAIGLPGSLGYFTFSFLWGIADASLELTGCQRTEVNWFSGHAAGLPLALTPLIPVAVTLWAASVLSRPASGRRLRPWAIAHGSITGMLLIVDVLMFVVAAHLTHLI
jgi:hypothetical protein